MKQETLQALKDSIAHWKKMRDDRKCGEEPTAEYCALCRRFLNEHTPCIRSGEKCPVFAATGRPGCGNTPLDSIWEAFYLGGVRRWRVAAQREIDFLESLLPTDNK